MVEANNITKKYRDFLAVDGVSFSIQPNEVTALLGLNGAGKTTTLRMLTGVLSATSGQIYINSINLFEQPMQFKQQIGYLPERCSFYPNMTVVKLLSFFYRLRKGTIEGEEEAIKNSIEKTQLVDKKNHLIGQLSAGYHKRLGLAQAIVHQPPVLILDEPISDLDPIQIIEVRNLILSLKKEHTILLSSHILSEVSHTADQCLFIREGKIIAQKTCQEIKEEKTDLEKLFIKLNQ